MVCGSINLLTKSVLSHSREMQCLKEGLASMIDFIHSRRTDEIDKTAGAAS